MSVIVPARDALPGVIALLDALAAQSLPRDSFEAIVVDDGSRDGTADAVEAHAVGARVVRRDRPGGSYAARNDALALATAAAVAFTDVDCVPEPDWLEAGLRRLEGAERRLVAGHVEVPLRAQPSLAEQLDVARFLDQEKAVGMGFAATANLFVPMAGVEEFGRFDDRLRSGGDAEFCARAVAHGYWLEYGGDVRVVHPPRSTPREVARKAYRVGVGLGQQRRFRVGQWGDRRPMWQTPGAWRKPRVIQGEERLAAAGHAPDERRRRQLLRGQYVLVHLPLLLGSVRGQLGR